MTAPNSASTSPRGPAEREARSSAEPFPRGADVDTLLLLFAIAFTVCILAPVFTRGFFPLYRTLPWSSLVDFFTPIILMPLYWLLFSSASASAASPSRRETAVFVTIASLWVLGHGIHLAANSIGYAMRPLPPSYAKELAHLYDEVLGHYFWHGGILALSALITLKSARSPAGAGSVAMRVIAAGFYGFTYFLVIVEGGTGPIGVPFAAAFVIVSLVRSRTMLARRPIHGFFFVAHLLASALFVLWAALHAGRLPQFSEVGIID